MSEKNIPKDINVIVATDCGSTTTKAILIQKIQDENGEWIYRQTFRGEAPTTVEAPFEDVTMGVLNAINELEDLSGIKILDENSKIIRPSNGKIGTDVYISTSSAGGGLQMMVTGVVRNMSAESAERAALAAGAIVMDVISANDKRLAHEQIERIRQLRPDMMLLAGGIDGGTVSHVMELTELVYAADPKPRLGGLLPIIYAGNTDVAAEVEKKFKGRVDLSIVDNVRPTLDDENIAPARDKVHDLFMEHVMAQAPGYKKLMKWTDVPIMPTPGAVGLIMEEIAKRDGINVVGVDIGGATTDVFSVFDGKFNRTVSANLGMSYSISNVFAEAGLPNVMRWVPFNMNEQQLRNSIKNKMIRPTTIPQKMQDLILEQAVAKEALRLSFVQHKEFATELKGTQKKRTISDAFSQGGGDGSLINMMRLDMLVGSGGVLSHAPRRAQTALMLLDAFQPEGFTKLTVDSIFMMPQLGVLTEISPEAAVQVFERDCIIFLGETVAPVGVAKKEDAIIAEYSIKMPDGTVITDKLQYGTMKKYPLASGAEAEVTITPAAKFNMGAGNGKAITQKVSGGVVGLILDGRGRPFNLPTEPEERVKKLSEWMKVLEIYPERAFNEEK